MNCQSEASSPKSEIHALCKAEIHASTRTREGLYAISETGDALHRYA